MEQKLYIARHAHALAVSPDDQRPLSEKGERQIDRIVHGLSNKNLLAPNAIWHSGYRRSLETAQGLAAGLGISAPFIQTDDLTPYDNPTPVSEKIHRNSDNILIVGHEPNLSALTSLLLSGNIDSPHIVFEKASILCMTRMKVGQQSTPWQIQWHINHKHFK